MRYRLLLIILTYFFLAVNSYGQNEKYTTISVNEGLPSNYVYRTIEDDKGFLWVATEAGLARYDGKNFQVYTTKDGLPDNVVLGLAKEKNGRIWVSCFKQSPAYFDEIQNRFIQLLSKKFLAKITTSFYMSVFSFKDGGVMYANNNGSLVFKDNKITHYFGDTKNGRDFGFLVQKNTDGTVLRFGSDNQKRRNKSNSLKIYHTKGSQLIDSKLLPISGTTALSAGINDGKFYLFVNSIGKCYVFSGFKTNPLDFKIDSVRIPEPYVNYSFTGTGFYLMAKSGKIYVFDKTHLQLTNVLQGNFLPNSYYNDTKGNQWVSTIDKGLVVYRNKPLTQIKMPPSYFKTNFLSIAKKTDGAILVGNYYGEVLEIKDGKFSIHPITKWVTSRIRKILLSGTDTFVFSEDGIFYNYKHQIINPLNNRYYSGKTAIKYNDSTILVGTIHNGLLKLNTKTKKINNTNSNAKRVTALTKTTKNEVYFGSFDGLYKYNFVANTSTSLSAISPILNERINALCATPDNLLWVSTTENGIVALKNDKIVIRINLNNTVNDDPCQNIIAGKSGQIWTATTHGINVISYKLDGNTIKYKTQNLSVNDGLSNNQVQEMLYQDGKVYAATADGITIIPENFLAPKLNIPVYLVNMTINQRDTIIANKYDLAYNEQNIKMQFAAVDLSSHFKYLQYTLDNNEHWIKLNENTITVQLSHGNHNMRIRAVDESGNASTNILILKFNIATPFWKAIWFWIVTAIILQFFIIYLINKRQRKRKEQKLVKRIAEVQTAELEQQAFTSLMNPHFIFNALNSIQHYINVQDRQNANRYLSDFASLIRKNFEGAQQSFIPLEEEIENIKIYLNLEQMRFDDRFKYKLKIDTNLDAEDWMIPTMILQPLLENALLHGIMPSNIAGKVLVNFSLQDKDLLIVITDNGIGIINSDALKTNQNHKSRGMELIKKRIKALSSLGTKPVTMTMAPAYKSKKNPGNKITFLIPMVLHQAWLKAKHS